MMRCMRSSFFQKQRPIELGLLLRAMHENHLPRVVALSGKAGHGKDTVANYLRDKHGFKTVSFAQPLKTGLSTMLALDPEFFEDRVLKEKTLEEYGKSPRQLMQWMGTDVLRAHIRDDIFIMTMKKRLHTLLALKEDVVISDCRFDAEAALVHDLNKNGPLARTVVWLVDASLRLPLGVAGEHVTEKGISRNKIDKIVSNNGNTVNLFKNVERALEDL